MTVSEFSAGKVIFLPPQRQKESLYYSGSLQLNLQGLFYLYLKPTLLTSRWQRLLLTKCCDFFFLQPSSVLCTAQFICLWLESCLPRVVLCSKLCLLPSASRLVLCLVSSETKESEVCDLRDCIAGSLHLLRWSFLMSLTFARRWKGSVNEGR